MSIKNPDEESSLAEAVEAYPLGPRRAGIEGSTPRMNFTISKKDQVWSDNIRELLAKAEGEAWSTLDIPWEGMGPLDEPSEAALCRLLTFIVEHEYLSLYLMSKFLWRINPYYTEAVLLLSHYISDDARHIGLFTKRVRLGQGFQGTSQGSQYAFKGILDMEDFSKAMFIMGLIGKGAMADLLDLLSSLKIDDGLSTIFERVLRDELRHVEYALGKTRYLISRNPGYEDELIATLDEKLAYLYIVSCVEEGIKEAIATLAKGKGAEEAAVLHRLYRIIDERRIDRLRQAGISEAGMERIVGAYKLTGSGLC